jgi:hypothetical protein
MKTTIESPDDLFVAAKKRAAETRSTLRELVERGLRRELGGAGGSKRRRSVPVRWVIVEGDLAPNLDLSDRAAMSDWVRRI